MRFWSGGEKQDLKANNSSQWYFVIDSCYSTFINRKNDNSLFAGEHCFTWHSEDIFVLNRTCTNCILPITRNYNSNDICVLKSRSKSFTKIKAFKNVQIFHNIGILKTEKAVEFCLMKKNDDGRTETCQYWLNKPSCCLLG